MDTQRFVARHVADLPKSGIRDFFEIVAKMKRRDLATLERPVRDGGKSNIINIQPGDTTDRNFAIAIDIGTTTVYGQLLDLVSGNVLAEHADFNAQITYGEDVISRIMFAEKPGGLDILHEVLMRTINKIIFKIVQEAHLIRGEISTITLAGNTTMTQILLKVDPSYIRRSPYVPASMIYPLIPAAELGIDLAEHATALVYPNISSFVGGDIVAGVMGSGCYLSSKLSLFIDIGTNAEVVIGNKDWLVCAACSAGPAFEGGGVQFGMRAVKGAIEDFSVDPKTFEPMILTVRNVRPVGICGTGLINIVANLFEAGVIDHRGKFHRRRSRAIMMNSFFVIASIRFSISNA